MQTLILEEQEAVAILTFNRPDMLNSLNDVMAQELLNTVKYISENKHIKVVILKGAGNAFMAGGDIGFFYQHLKSLTNKAPEIIELVHQVVSTIQQSNAIFIASVHGSAAGIGISFMSACDLVIASSDTQFTTAYSKVGLSPDGGASYCLTNTLGRKKAFELLALSETFSASEAKSSGMINWICEPNLLQTETQKLAERLLKGPSLAFSKIKKLVNQAEHVTLKEQLEAEAEGFVQSTQTKDFANGVTSFIQKKPANFEGI